MRTLPAVPSATRAVLRDTLAALALVTTTACGGGGGGSSGGDRLPDADTLVVATRIGVVDGDPDRTFGGISGLALDEAGNVWVVDIRNHDVRAFSPDGQLVARLGGEGDGPGQLRRPCCPFFGPEGRFWVQNAGPPRYLDAFDVGAEAPRHTLRVTPEVESPWPGRIGIDAAGRPMLLQLEDIDSVHSRRQVVLLLDTTGAVVKRTPVRHLSPGDLGWVEVSQAYGNGLTARAWSYPPFHPTVRIGYGYDGRIAWARSDEYRILLFDAAGDSIGAVIRPVDGPALSPAERDSTAAQISRDEQAFTGRGARVSHTPDVPERKPVLADVFFDLDGRLWVMRTPADGDTHLRADVFDRSGRPLFAVAVPTNVELKEGVVRGDVAWGIETGELDVQRIVRLRLPLEVQK